MRATQFLRFLSRKKLFVCFVCQKCNGLEHLLGCKQMELEQSISSLPKFIERTSTSLIKKMDFVQIRRQQIRLAEASQSIVRENYELKQKVAQLQISKTLFKQPTKLSYDQKVIENIRELVLEYTKHLNQFLLRIKAEFAEQNQTLAEFQQVFRQTISQYELLLAEKSEELVAAAQLNNKL